MKKVLFLTSRLPIPANDGRSKTLKQYIDILLEKYEVYLVSFNQDKDIMKQDPRLKLIETIEYPSFLRKIINVLTLSLFCKEPLQVSAVYSKKTQKKIDKLVDTIHPDVIICDMIRTSRFVLKNKYKCKKILDMDDVFSKRYFECFETEKKPLGQLSLSMPKWFIKCIDYFNLSKIILKFEYKKIKNKEIKVCNYFDKIVLVSDVEVSYLKTITKLDNIISWPVALNEVYEVKKTYLYDQICFLGNMNASQNVTTLNYIMEKIMPKLPDYKVLVIGKCSLENAKLFEKYNNIKFTFEVESIVPYVQSSLCLLAPIQYGSGIKIKVLEAMSLGVPVITSNVGVEGINAHNNTEILIADDIDDYVSSIKLLSNKVIRNKIANASVDFIKENHIYDNVKIKIFNSIDGDLNE